MAHDARHMTRGAWPGRLGCVEATACTEGVLWSGREQWRDRGGGVRDGADAGAEHDLMDAQGGKDDLFVSVESYTPPNQLVFSVSTPCFLAAGVKQQQVSASAPDASPVTRKDPRLALMAPVGSAYRGNPFG